MAVGVYFMTNRAGVSIVCITGQACLLCASWDTGYLICASHVGGCLFCASWDTGYPISASHGSGCLFGAQQDRVIYRVSHRTAMSIVCFLAHRISNVCLTWQWVSILCQTGQGYLLFASRDRRVYFVPPGTQGIEYVSHMEVDIFSAPHRKQGV